MSDLAAQRELALVRDARGDAANGADVGRDLLALDAVAARGGLDDAPALVDDLDARAVELRLDREARHVAVAEPVDDASMELEHVLGRVRVVEREHPVLAPDLRDEGSRLAAHALRRRVGRDELGVLGLERPQLLHEHVELRRR